MIVFAEVVETAIRLFRERQDDWLAERRSKLEAFVDEERQALDQVAQARIKMWDVAQFGPYIQALADDGPFGRQPVPQPAPPPAQFDAERARQMLERHWSAPKPWLGDDGEPVRSWLDQQDGGDVEPLAGEDETGVVSGLVETGAEA